MEKYLTVSHCLALGEEIEKLTSAYKSLMFAENFGAELDEDTVPPELLAAFAECAECCRDLVDLYDYYQNKPSQEESVADFIANYDSIIVEGYEKKKK